MRRNCASLSNEVGLNQQILDSGSYVNIPETYNKERFATNTGQKNNIKIYNITRKMSLLFFLWKTFYSTYLVRFQ